MFMFYSYYYYMMMMAIITQKKHVYAAVQGVRRVGHGHFYRGRWWGYAHQARAVLHYCAMFQAKYDYKPVKMEFGWHRKALDACMVGDLAKLKLVVKNRSKEVGYRVNINDVYDEDFWGCSCLHRAAENGHYEVLVYLIEKLNHDVLTVANDKTTASWQAWFFGHKKCYHYLKKQEHIQSSSKSPLQQRIHTNNNL